MKRQYIKAASNTYNLKVGDEVVWYEDNEVFEGVGKVTSINPEGLFSVDWEDEGSQDNILRHNLLKFIRN